MLTKDVASEPCIISVRRTVQYATADIGMVYGQCCANVPGMAKGMAAGKSMIPFN